MTDLVESPMEDTNKSNQSKSILQQYLFNRKGLKTSILLIALLSIIQTFQILMQKLNEGTVDKIFRDFLTSQSGFNQTE